MFDGKIAVFEEISDLVQHVYFWGGVVIAICLGAIKLWRSRRASATFLEMVHRNFGIGSVLDRKLLRCMTCVVVDDKPDDFPVEFMRGFFYSVVVETKVSLNDAHRLSQFDVIFLDVADVVSEDARRGGALLIERIRQYRQDGIIVSVSSKKYDVEVTRYFEAADIRIRKPVTANSIEEQFMAHLGNKVGPESLAREIDEAVLRVAGARKLKSAVKLMTAPRGIQGAPRPIQLAGVTEQYLRLASELGKIG